MPASNVELQIRRRLEDVLQRLRSRMSRCPTLQDLHAVDATVDLDVAATAVAAARTSLLEALACVEELATVPRPGADTVALVATAGAGIAAVAEVLDALAALVESRRAA